MRNQNRNVYNNGSGRAFVRNAAAICALLFFSVFLALKVNGYLDFSASFGIKELMASRESPNLQLLLDREPGTVWGTMQSASGGDWLEITFRNSRQIKAVELEADAENCPELELCRMDPVNGAWIPCSCSRDENRLIPEEVLEAEKIRLQVSDGQTDVPWIVKALRIV